jgi:hypothetical protein
MTFPLTILPGLHNKSGNGWFHNPDIEKIGRACRGHLLGYRYRVLCNLLASIQNLLEFSLIAQDSLNILETFPPR